jgi:hypothetical protein
MRGFWSCWGTIPSGDRRRCGSRSATWRVNAVQNPWLQNANISSQINSTSSFADLCEPCQAASRNRLCVHGPVWSGTPAPCRCRWLRNLAALCGIDATLSPISAQPRSPRTNEVQSPTSSNVNAVSSAYLRNACSARRELGSVVLASMLAWRRRFRAIEAP